MENDQPQGVEADPLERMTDFLGEEDEAEPAEAESEAEESEPEDEEESQEEAEAAPEAEEAVEVIIHNGVEKQLTKAELKEYAQQGFDATQKWQAAAERQRYLDQREAAVQYQEKFAAQFTDQLAQAKAIESQLEQWKGVNWAELAQTDPMQYLSLHHQYTEAKEAYQTQIQTLNQAQQQAQQVAAQQQAQLKATEAQAMRQAIPEWKDPARAQAEWSEIDSALVKAGYEPGTLNSILDHRQVLIARDAMLYRKLMASGKQKVAAAPPPTAKPGTTAKPKSNETQKLRDSLRKTGRGEYAAELIARTLK